MTIITVSFEQETKDNSQYSLYSSRVHKSSELQTKNFEEAYRKRKKIQRSNFHEKLNLKAQESRIAFNSDNNLQRDYIATTVGKDIQLDCKIRDVVNDDGKVVWLKMPKGEILTLNGNRVTQDQRVSAKCAQHQIPCWSLFIQEARESDTGFYVCQTNSMQTKYIYLDIMVPPKLLTNYPVDRLDVNQNKSSRIACEFYGKPEPLIKWYRYEGGNQKEIGKYRISAWY